MKKIPYLLFAALLAGCLSHKTPYDHLENWLIRDDPVRPTFIPADVIYVPPELYVDVKAVPRMYSYAKDAVGRRKLAGVARVFSPLVANEEDVRFAVEWYLKNHHEEMRPIVFIGEGEGGALLKAYEEHNASKLAKLGLVKSFYAEKPYEGFVSEEMVGQIKHAIARAKYRLQWKREMPEGMLEQ